MLTIDDFNEPESHPFGMLENVVSRHACEVEGFMWWFLKQCKTAKDIDAEVTTRNCEDHLTEIDLLCKVGKKTYTLTDKSKRLLFSQYGIV